MATIKAYTDLEQSHRLAEILPIESADMKWFFWKSEIGTPKIPTFGYIKDVAESYKNTEAVYLPCWSLAALLNYLREVDYFPDILADEHDVEMSVIYYDTEEGDMLHPLHKISVEEKTFLDACVEMIIKLYKFNILT